MIRYLKTGAGAIALLVAAQSSAQAPASAPRTTQFETRAELEAASRTAASENRAGEAALLRARLQHGDFQEGDRILVAVDVPGLRSGEATGLRTGADNDTVIVRAGKLSQFSKLPNIPDLSLEGVLRSELVDTITAHLRKYLRDPTVRATPLVRLAVMGAVGRPGWYSTPTDVILADVIMQAGGVSAEADVPNTVVRRAGDVIWNAKDVRLALADGLSLDRLHLRAGDEIYVAPQRRWGVGSALQILTAIAGVYAAMRAFNPPHT